MPAGITVPAIHNSEPNRTIRLPPQDAAIRFFDRADPYSSPFMIDILSRRIWDYGVGSFGNDSERG
jgi:hypothetical protein